MGVKRGGQWSPLGTGKWTTTQGGFLGPPGVIFIDVGSGHTSVHLVTTTSSRTVTNAAIICMYVMVNKKVYKK